MKLHVPLSFHIHSITAGQLLHITPTSPIYFYRQGNPKRLMLLALCLLLSFAFSHSAWAQRTMVLFPGETYVEKQSFDLCAEYDSNPKEVLTQTFGQPSSPLVQIAPMVLTATYPDYGPVNSTYTVTYTAPESPGNYNV